MSYWASGDATAFDQAAMRCAGATAGPRWPSLRPSASMRSSAGQQPPHRAPARHVEAISSTVLAPDAMAASIVRSVTDLQEHTYTGVS